MRQSVSFLRAHSARIKPLPSSSSGSQSEDEMIAAVAVDHDESENMLPGDGGAAIESPLLEGALRRSRRDAIVSLDVGISSHDFRQIARDARLDSATTCGERLRLKLLAFWTTAKRYGERLHLKHFVPLFLLVGYSLLGAVAFYASEKPAEAVKLKEQKAWLVKHKLKLDVAKVQVLDRFWEIHLESSYQNFSKPRIIWMVEEVLSWYDNHHTKVKMRKLSKPKWDNFLNALFYAGTVYTTIGYGNIAPVSNLGKVLTIIYSIFGVPIMFFVLHKLGRMFCYLLMQLWDLIKKLWKLVCCCYCRYGKFKRVRTKLTVEEGVVKEGATQFDENGQPIDEASEEGEAAGEEEEEEPQDARHLYDVPFSLALALTFGWMLFCAGLFTIWEEDWSYFTSFYFFFISLTTIGFGDVVPKHLDYMIMNFGLVIIGLSLVTMCINLVQVKLEHLFQETMMMILKKYQDAQVRGENAEMPPNEFDASFGIMQLLQTQRKAKWLQNLMGAKQKDMLVKEWQAKANMLVHGTQTDWRWHNVATQTPPWMQPAPAKPAAPDPLINRTQGKPPTKPMRLSKTEPILKAVHPVPPAKPVKPVKPVQPAQPVQPVKPVQPAQPVQPVQPVRRLDFSELIVISFPSSDSAPSKAMLSVGTDAFHLPFIPPPLLVNRVCQTLPTLVHERAVQANYDMPPATLPPLPPPPPPVPPPPLHPTMIVTDPSSTSLATSHAIIRPVDFDVPPIDAPIPLPAELYSLASPGESIPGTGSSMLHSEISSTANTFLPAISSLGYGGSLTGLPGAPRTYSNPPSRGSIAASSTSGSEHRRPDRFSELVKEIDTLLTDCRNIVSTKEDAPANDPRLQQWFVGTGVYGNPRGASTSKTIHPRSNTLGSRFSS